MQVFKIFFALASVAIGFFGIAEAQDSVVVSVFVREECGHCRDEKAFLTELEKEMPRLEVRYYDLAIEKNDELFGEIASRYQLVKGTPLTLIKGNLLQGFDTAKTTGRVIKRLIEGEGENTTFEEIVQGGAQVADVLGLGAVCADGTVCGVDAPQALVRIPLINSPYAIWRNPLIPAILYA